MALLACCLAWPSWAMLPAPDVIVGRADADASGGWPVMLWVVDGERSHVIVRAPRQRLGQLPWRPADAQALMSLERFGAPKLTQEPGPSRCAAGRGSAAAVEPSQPWAAKSHDDSVAHPACGAGDCGRSAWRVDLPPRTGEELPLARLMPGLAAKRPEWLVLYVVSPLPALPLAGLVQLSLTDALRGPRSQAQWSQLRLPAEAASRFPAIHTALLEQAAADQGLANASVLMRADDVTQVWQGASVGPWDGSEAQYRALGMQSSATTGGSAIVRLLLRLMPGDRPGVLQPQASAWQAQASHAETLWALMPADEAPATLQQRCDDLVERQHQAWRWVEQMTGRPADSWRAR